MHPTPSRASTRVYTLGFTAVVVLSGWGCAAESTPTALGDRIVFTESLGDTPARQVTLAFTLTQEPEGLLAINDVSLDVSPSSPTSIHGLASQLESSLLQPHEAWRWPDVATPQRSEIAPLLSRIQLSLMIMTAPVHPGTLLRARLSLESPGFGLECWRLHSDESGITLEAHSWIVMNGVHSTALVSANGILKDGTAHLQGVRFLNQENTETLTISIKRVHDPDGTLPH